MGITQFIIIVIMILLNSLFAGYELALTTVNLGRIKLFSEQKRKGAHSALFMKTRMGASLAVVQIGVTLVGAMAAAISGAEAEYLLTSAIASVFSISESIAKAIAIMIIVLPLSAVTIIFGELVPKTIALKNNEKVCLLLSPMMRAFAFLTYPLVFFFEWFTKVIVGLFERRIPHKISQQELGIIELRAQARALRTSSVIDSDQEKIIIGASNLSRIKVLDILIPAKDIVTLFADGDLTDHIVTVHLEGYTRFPVTEARSDPQKIIGYVNIKELIFLAKTHPENPSLREILRPALFLSPDIDIGEAFSIMIKGHTHLAIVKDESNNILGMITMEDILEEVVGDIQDEFDRMPRYINKFGGRQFVAGGGVQMSLLLESLHLTGQLTDEIAGINLSEWIIRNNNKKLTGGDYFTIDNINILIRKVRRNRVWEAIVSVKER
ncbi:MAG: hemolysin family protein [Spirochaetota bacterium]